MIRREQRLQAFDQIENVAGDAGNASTGDVDVSHYTESTVTSMILCAACMQNFLACLMKVECFL